MKIIAHDTAITLAATSGQFELNAFLPLIADSLLESLDILHNAVEMFRTACIDGLSADPASCRHHLEASTAPALLLVPHIGYDAAAALAEEARATGKTLRQLAQERHLLTPEITERLFPSKPITPDP